MDLSIGDNVYLICPLPYLKTADEKPILRPSDLVSPEEIGEILELDGFDFAKVKFRRGIFWIPTSHLSANFPMNN